MLFVKLTSLSGLLKIGKIQLKVDYTRHPWITQNRENLLKKSLFCEERAIDELLKDSQIDVDSTDFKQKFGNKKNGCQICGTV